MKRSTAFQLIVLRQFTDDLVSHRPPQRSARNRTNNESVVFHGSLTRRPLEVVEASMASMAGVLMEEVDESFYGSRQYFHGHVHGSYHMLPWKLSDECLTKQTKQHNSKYSDIATNLCVCKTSVSNWHKLRGKLPDSGVGELNLNQPVGRYLQTKRAKRRAGSRKPARLSRMFGGVLRYGQQLYCCELPR